MLYLPIQDQWSFVHTGCEKVEYRQHGAGDDRCQEWRLRARPSRTSVTTMALRCSITCKLAANQRLLHVIDSTLCLLIFFPSMVFYWRGIWDLYGVYISPNDPFVSNWAVFGLGCGTIFGYFIHLIINRLLRDVTNRVFYFVVSRVYMYMYGILLMAYWRGAWTVADYYLNEYGWHSALVGLLTCYPLLVVLCSSRSVLFPPFIVCLDTRSSVLVPSTRFQTQVNTYFTCSR